MNRIAIALLTLIVLTPVRVESVVAAEPKEKKSRVFRARRVETPNGAAVALEIHRGTLTASTIIIGSDNEAQITISACEKGVQLAVSGNTIRATEMEIKTRSKELTVIRSRKPICNGGEQ